MHPRVSPPWCLWRHGASPQLIVAPHGGRRDDSAGARPDRATALKVNDLHTADLAAELAAALKASLLVNPFCDRNRLDLNRISQVRTRAPWFLALLDRLLAAIVARHGRAEVLFIHGWNVVQARCDAGVGARLAAPEDAVDAAERLTISRACAAARLLALQRACAARGIALSFGERYPGQHPNNLLQLFRHTPAAPGPPLLASCRRSGAVDAIQLELGVPLRWPGVVRGAFIAAVASVFREVPGGTARQVVIGGSGSAEGGHPMAARRSLAPSPRSSTSHTPDWALPTGTYQLQAYDARAQIGIALRGDREGPGGPSGRVLVFLGADRVALFVGESARGGPPVEGPIFRRHRRGVAVTFDGFALTTDQPCRYVDLEDAFAASTLAPLHVALRFEPGDTAEYGPVEGTVEIAGARHALAALGFARHGILERSRSAWLSRVALLAALGSTRAMRATHEVPGAAALYELGEHGERHRPIAELSVHFAGPDRPVPTRIVAGRNALACRPLAAMSIVRPLAPHRRAQITFGPAAFATGDAEGFGFYEYGRVLSVP